MANHSNESKTRIAARKGSRVSDVKAKSSDVEIEADNHSTVSKIDVEGNQRENEESRLWYYIKRVALVLSILGVLVGIWQAFQVYRGSTSTEPNPTPVPSASL